MLNTISQYVQPRRLIQDCELAFVASISSRRRSTERTGAIKSINPIKQPLELVVLAGICQNSPWA